MGRRVAIVLVLLFAATAYGQSVPRAIYTDPPTDKAHPAKMTVLAIPTHGVIINGLIYQPAGAGRHPTMVLCHGLPGNEKNLDVAQAVRRAGWNAVTFNYRGSWGSPGDFRFAHTIEDTEAVLSYLRKPENAEKLGIDTRRIVLAGHSMGGWVTVHVAAEDHALEGAIIFSAADMSAVGSMPREKLVALMADNMNALAGVTPESMADEVEALGKNSQFTDEASDFIHTRLLALTAADGLAPQTDALVNAIRAEGGKEVTEVHVDTDHGWSDRRIALESCIIRWLQKLP